MTERERRIEGAIIRTCKCGAVRVLTSTGVRYEENAGAICRHRTDACDWFTRAALALPKEEAAPGPQYREGGAHGNELGWSEPAPWLPRRVAELPVGWDRGLHTTACINHNWTQEGGDLICAGCHTRAKIELTDATAAVGVWREGKTGDGRLTVPTTEIRVFPQRHPSPSPSTGTAPAEEPRTGCGVTTVPIPPGMAMKGRPAPSPHRHAEEPPREGCPHRNRMFTRLGNQDCIDCGATWRDDGEGWREKETT